MANVFKEFTQEKLDEIRTHSYYKSRSLHRDRASRYEVFEIAYVRHER